METTATLATAPADTSKLYLWAGRILTGFIILFFVMDGGFKVAQPQMVIEMSGDLGWPPSTSLIVMLGSILLLGTALYAYPRTAVLGAIILTGYLGGAVATHVRIGSPLLTHSLFGIYMGVMMWGGLWFRSPRLRALIPLSR